MANHFGTLTYHDPDGVEVFVLDSATIQAFQRRGEVKLLFYVGGEMQVDRRRHLTNAEVSVFLTEFHQERLVGQRFEVPRSYDEKREDHVSCFYRYAHNDLNWNVVEVLGREGERFRVRWTGTTNDTDPGECETAYRVVIEAAFDFSFEKAKTRS